jgi:glycosyltransferase involved in cell wall biosynthesis
MKVAYITRVTIPNRVAQAEQIMSMSRAFGIFMKDDFLLVSPTNKSRKLEKPIFNHHTIYIKTTHIILRNLVFGIKIFKFLKNNKIDYIYTRDILIAFIATRFFKITTAYEAHQPIRGKVAKFLQKSVSSNEKFKLVTITNSLKEYYNNLFSYKNKINVITNGVFFEDYSNVIQKEDLRKELNIPEDKFIIVHTGSLFQNRGFEKFEIILANFPNLLLYQLGGKPKDIELLKSKMKDYKNIKFIDYQPKELVVKYQKSADALLYLTSTKSPIYWCTSPNKIFEYMATKNPIIAPKIGSIPEVLNDENSYLFNLDANESLLATIKEVINRKDNNKALKAYDEVANNYSMEKRVEKITEILKVDKHEK